MATDVSLGRWTISSSSSPECAGMHLRDLGYAEGCSTIAATNETNGPGETFEWGSRQDLAGRDRAARD